MKLSSVLHLILFFSITKPSHSRSNLGNETDRLALLEFKAQISGDPNGILSSWNESADFCRWEGVTCGNKHKRVVSLDLRGMSLMGTLSPYIRNLTFLRFLRLRDNKFHGVIPEEVGYLFRLRNLNLSYNNFEGGIPPNISYCSNLITLDLANNNLSGKIPAQLGSFKKLVALGLFKNKLIGAIPDSLGNLSSLELFSLAYNHLRGSIPNDLGRLTSLTYFVVDVNNLTGTIPSTLYNLSSLTVFAVAGNQLQGSLPPNIGLTLPNLQIFANGGNHINGSIPISLTNASQLQVLDMSYNKLAGQVPNHIGYLKSLQRLNFEENFLGNNASKDLNFMKSLSNISTLIGFSIAGNNFGGLLPISIANMSNLRLLFFADNQIYGKIPSQLGNLVNLHGFTIYGNLFSGPIPDEIGKLENLQRLSMGKNKLSGEIPESLCNITYLAELVLDQNKLEGSLTNIANCKNLQALILDANNLTGSVPQQIMNSLPLVNLSVNENALTGFIPLEVGRLKSINVLDISENKLSGKIPDTLGDCLSLEILYLRGNMFQEDIPSSLASLKGLKELDLSRNNLSGNIPRELENLMFLQYLKLSFNNLRGEVPKEGVFRNISAFSFDGNSDLCGGIPELQLPACPIKEKKYKKSTKTIILATTISPIVIFITIIFLYIFYRRNSRKNQFPKLFEEDKIPRISYNELLKGTNGFSSDNIIGEGSFGFVYRGILDSQGEKLVAVKVLKLQKYGASKSFLAECKAFRNIRHRNLVKMLTYCSSIDFKGNDFKALVYDFMENESLDVWLHPREVGSRSSRNLSLLQRLQVAIDVSSALHYLHENCETPIIHCDLKPSNILFDGDMTAHVSDFGLARLLLQQTNDSSQGETSSIGIKGTIGYMAPEYGTDNKATKCGDVYSFGIILLEIFTGRRPTDQVFNDGLNLHIFVKSNLPGRVMQILDPVLFTTGDFLAELTTSEVVASLGQDKGEVYKCITSVLEVGLSCTAERPGDRMHMGDVTRKLNVIKESFLRPRSIEAKQPKLSKS